MRPKRDVFDTNIWVSYVITARLEELTRFIFDNNLMLLSSAKLVAELTDVLSRPKFNRYLQRPIEEYVAFHRALTTSVSVQPLYQNSPDPKDNFLFDIAQQAQAGYVVTGDKRLLALGVQDGVRFIDLADYLALLT